MRGARRIGTNFTHQAARGKPSLKTSTTIPASANRVQCKALGGRLTVIYSSALTGIRVRCRYETGVELSNPRDNGVFEPLRTPKEGCDIYHILLSYKTENIQYDAPASALEPLAIVP